MWRKLALAALLTSTSITPAHAGPLVVFVQGLAASLTAGLASSGIGAFFGTALGKLVLSYGLSAIANALTPRPSTPSPAERLVNYAQPLTYFEWVYGRVRKGGPLGFTGFSGGKRHYCPIIACHSTEGPVAHYLDDREVEIDGSGNVTTAPITGSPAVGNIRTYTGQSGQAADATLVAAFPGQVGAGHDFEGLSYAAIWGRRVAPEVFSSIYPSGREWQYTAVWDGCDTIYDPRDASTGWSDNAALVIAHNVVRHGKSVDWTEVGEEADKCDVLVTNATGGTQKKWTINGVFDESQTWEDVRQQLALAADVWWYERSDGKVGFKVGAWEAPTVTLTAADILSIQIAERQPGPDVVGEFTMRYIEPAQDWTEAVSGAWVEVAGGQRQESACYLIDSHNQAARVLKRIAKQTRPQYQITATIKLRGYDLIGQRFVRIEHAETGLAADFEIGKLMRNQDRLTFLLEAVSTAEADFAFTAATEEPDQPTRIEPVSDDAVAVVAGFTGQAVEDTGGAAAIVWSWTAGTDDLRQEIRIRCVALGLDWQTIAAGPGETSLTVTGLADGQTYDAQVRNRTAANRVSDWSATVSVAAVANTTAPGPLSGVSATAVGSDGLVEWTCPSDANFYAARIWRHTTTTFGSATLIRTEYGLPGAADEYTDPSPGAGTWYYWAAPINASGVAGTVSGPHSITI